MNLFYAFVRALIYIPVRIFFPVRVINKKLFPKERKLIVVSNHLSWFDIVLVAIYIPKYRHFIAKKEIGKNPIIRLLAKMLGVILIDRDKPDLKAVRSILNVLKKNQGITLFPEGTRNREGEDLQEIKSGAVMFALKSGAPIAPVLILHKTKIFKKNYIYVSEPVSFVEYQNKQLSKVMGEASELLSGKMKTAQENLKEYVSELKVKKESKKKPKNKPEGGLEDISANEVTEPSDGVQE